MGDKIIFSYNVNRQTAIDGQSFSVSFYWSMKLVTDYGY